MPSFLERYRSLRRTVNVDHVGALLALLALVVAALSLLFSFLANARDDKRFLRENRQAALVEVGSAWEILSSTLAVGPGLFADPRASSTSALRASVHIRKARDLCPDLPELIEAEATALLLRGEVEKAEKLLDSHLPGRESSRSQLLRGVLALHKKDNSRAATLLNSVRDAPDIRSIDRTIIASAYAALGRERDAVDVLEQLLQIEPSYTPGLVGLEAIHATHAFKDSIAAVQWFILARKLKGQAEEAACTERGIRRIKLARSRYRLAAALAMRARRAKPNSPETRLSSLGAFITMLFVGEVSDLSIDDLLQRNSRRWNAVGRQLKAEDDLWSLTFVSSGQCDVCNDPGEGLIDAISCAAQDYLVAVDSDADSTSVECIALQKSISRIAEITSFSPRFAAPIVLSFVEGMDSEPSKQYQSKVQWLSRLGEQEKGHSCIDLVRKNFHDVLDTDTLSTLAEDLAERYPDDPDVAKSVSDYYAYRKDFFRARAWLAKSKAPGESATDALRRELTDAKWAHDRQSESRLARELIAADPCDTSALAITTDDDIRQGHVDEAVRSIDRFDSSCPTQFEIGFALRLVFGGNTALIHPIGNAQGESDISDEYAGFGVLLRGSH